MTHNIIKSLAALALGATLLTGCGKEQNIPQQSDQPTDNRTHSTSDSDTIPENASIVGDWEYVEATSQGISPEGWIIDTVYYFGQYAPVKDMVFYSNGTVYIEMKNDACVVPPTYDTVNFLWTMDSGHVSLNNEFGSKVLNIDTLTDDEFRFAIRVCYNDHDEWHFYSYRRR